MERMAGEAEFNEFVVARSSALMRTAYLLTLGRFRSCMRTNGTCGAGAGHPAS